MYRPLHLLNPHSELHLKSHAGKLQWEMKKLPRRISLPSALKEMDFFKIFQNGLAQQIYYFKPETIFQSISAGYDSGVLLENLVDLKYSPITATHGLEKSDDVLIGKKRAHIVNCPHHYIGDFYQLKHDQLKQLIMDYSLLTGGFGPVPESITYDYNKRFQKFASFFVCGEGGEFYRNARQSREYFHQSHMTPMETCQKYLNLKYDKNVYLDRIDQLYGLETTFENFLLEEYYYKKNFRKYQIMKEFGIKITPMANPFLYQLVTERASCEKRDTDLIMDQLTPAKTHYPLKNKITQSCLDIDLFFKKINQLALETFQSPSLLTSLGINEKLIYSDLQKNRASSRDKWFISRIITLRFFLESFPMTK